EDRYAEITAQQVLSRRHLPGQGVDLLDPRDERPAETRLFEARCIPEIDVQQESIEGAGDRLDRIEIGGEARRRLSPAEREHAADVEAAQRVGGTEAQTLAAHEPRRLTVDVEAQLVVGKIERAIARRVPGRQVARRTLRTTGSARPLLG